MADATNEKRFVAHFDITTEDAEQKMRNFLLNVSRATHESTKGFSKEAEDLLKNADLSSQQMVSRLTSLMKRLYSTDFKNNITSIKTDIKSLNAQITKLNSEIKQSNKEIETSYRDLKKQFAGLFTGFRGIKDTKELTIQMEQFNKTVDETISKYMLLRSQQDSLNKSQKEFVSKVGASLKSLNIPIETGGKGLTSQTELFSGLPSTAGGPMTKEEIVSALKNRANIMKEAIVRETESLKSATTERNRIEQQELVQHYDKIKNTTTKHNAEMKEVNDINNAVIIKNTKSNLIKQEKQHQNFLYKLHDWYKEKFSVISSLAFSFTGVKLFFNMIIDFFASIVNGVNEAIKSFQELQSGIMLMSTLIDDATYKQIGGFNALKKMAKELAATYGVTFKEITDSMYLAISSGADPKNLKPMMDIANQLAIGGAATFNSVVDGITSVVNAFKNLSYAEEDLKKISDAMFIGMNYGKFTIETLAANLGQITTAASEMGMSMEETIGVLATLTTTGLSTEEASTQIRSALKTLLDPAKGAKEIMDSLGISYGLNALKGTTLVEKLIELRNALEAEGLGLQDVFENVRGLQGALALTSSLTGKYNQIMGEMNGITQTLGMTTERAYGNLADTVERTEKRAAAAWQNIVSSFGEFMAPLKNAWNNFIIGIGESAEAQFERVSKKLSETSKVMIRIKEVFGKDLRLISEEDINNVDDMNTKLSLVEKISPQIASGFTRIVEAIRNGNAELKDFYNYVAGIEERLNRVRIKDIDEYVEKMAEKYKEVAIDIMGLQKAVTSQEAKVRPLEFLLGGIEKGTALGLTSEQLREIIQQLSTIEGIRLIKEGYILQGVFKPGAFEEFERAGGNIDSLSSSFENLYRFLSQEGMLTGLSTDLLSTYLVDFQADLNTLREDEKISYDAYMAKLIEDLNVAGVENQDKVIKAFMSIFPKSFIRGGLSAETFGAMRNMILEAQKKMAESQKGEPAYDMAGAYENATTEFEKFSASIDEYYNTVDKSSAKTKEYVKDEIQSRKDALQLNEKQMEIAKQREEIAKLESSLVESSSKKVVKTDEDAAKRRRELLLLGIEINNVTSQGESRTISNTAELSAQKRELLDTLKVKKALLEESEKDYIKSVALGGLYDNYTVAFDKIFIIRSKLAENPALKLVEIPEFNYEDITTFINTLKTQISETKVGGEFLSFDLTKMSEKDMKVLDEYILKGKNIQELYAKLQINMPLSPETVKGVLYLKDEYENLQLEEKKREEALVSAAGSEEKYNEALKFAKRINKARQSIMEDFAKVPEMKLPPLNIEEFRRKLKGTFEVITRDIITLQKETYTLTATTMDPKSILNVDWEKTLAGKFMELSDALKAGLDFDEIFTEKYKELLSNVEVEGMKIFHKLRMSLEEIGGMGDSVLNKYLSDYEDVGRKIMASDKLSAEEKIRLAEDYYEYTTQMAEKTNREMEAASYNYTKAVAETKIEFEKVVVANLGNEVVIHNAIEQMIHNENISIHQKNEIIRNTVDLLDIEIQKYKDLIKVTQDAAATAESEASSQLRIIQHDMDVITASINKIQDKMLAGLPPGAEEGVGTLVTNIVTEIQSGLLSILNTNITPEQVGKNLVALVGKVKTFMEDTHIANIIKSMNLGDIFGDTIKFFISIGDIAATTPDFLENIRKSLKASLEIPVLESKIDQITEAKEDLTEATLSATNVQDIIDKMGLGAGGKKGRKITLNFDWAVDPDAWMKLDNLYKEIYDNIMRYEQEYVKKISTIGIGGFRSEAVTIQLETLEQEAQWEEKFAELQRRNVETLTKKRQDLEKANKEFMEDSKDAEKIKQEGWEEYAKDFENSYNKASQWLDSMDVIWGKLDATTKEIVGGDAVMRLQDFMTTYLNKAMGGTLKDLPIELFREKFKSALTTENKWLKDFVEGAGGDIIEALTMIASEKLLKLKVLTEEVRLDAITTIKTILGEIDSSVLRGFTDTPKKIEDLIEGQTFAIVDTATTLMNLYKLVIDTLAKKNREMTTEINNLDGYIIRSFDMNVRVLKSYASLSSLISQNVTANITDIKEAYEEFARILSAYKVFEKPFDLLLAEIGKDAPLLKEAIINTTYEASDVYKEYRDEIEAAAKKHNDELLRLEKEYGDAFTEIRQQVMDASLNAMTYAINQATLKYKQAILELSNSFQDSYRGLTITFLEMKKKAETITPQEVLQLEALKEEQYWAEYFSDIQQELDKAAIIMGSVGTEMGEILTKKFIDQLKDEEAGKRAGQEILNQIVLAIIEGKIDEVLPGLLAGLSADDQKAIEELVKQYQNIYLLREELLKRGQEYVDLRKYEEKQSDKQIEKTKVEIDLLEEKWKIMQEIRYAEMEIRGIKEDTVKWAKFEIEEAEKYLDYLKKGSSTLRNILLSNIKDAYAEIDKIEQSAEYKTGKRFFERRAEVMGEKLKETLVAGGGFKEEIKPKEIEYVNDEIEAQKKIIKAMEERLAKPEEYLKEIQEKVKRGEGEYLTADELNALREYYDALRDLNEKRKALVDIESAYVQDTLSEAPDVVRSISALTGPTGKLQAIKAVEKMTPEQMAERRAELEAKPAEERTALEEYELALLQEGVDLEGEKLKVQLQVNAATKEMLNSFTNVVGTINSLFLENGTFSTSKFSGAKGVTAITGAVASAGQGTIVGEVAGLLGGIIDLVIGIVDAAWAKPARDAIEQNMNKQVAFHKKITENLEIQNKLTQIAIDLNLSYADSLREQMALLQNKINTLSGQAGIGSTAGAMANIQGIQGSMNQVDAALTSLGSAQWGTWSSDVDDRWWDTYQSILSAAGMNEADFKAGKYTPEFVQQQLEHYREVLAAQLSENEMYIQYLQQIKEAQKQVIQNLYDYKTQIATLMGDEETALKAQLMGIEKLIEAHQQSIAAGRGGLLTEEEYITTLIKEADLLQKHIDQMEEKFKTLQELVEMQAEYMGYSERELTYLKLQATRDLILAKQAELDLATSLGYGEEYLIELAKELIDLRLQALELEQEYYSKRYEYVEEYNTLAIKRAELAGYTEEQLNQLRLASLDRLIEAKQAELDAAIAMNSSYDYTYDLENDLVDLQLERLHLQQELNGELDKSNALYDDQLRSYLRMVIQARKISDTVMEADYKMRAALRLRELGVPVEDIYRMLGIDLGMLQYASSASGLVGWADVPPESTAATLPSVADLISQQAEHYETVIALLEQSSGMIDVYAPAINQQLANISAMLADIRARVVGSGTTGGGIGTIIPPTVGGTVGGIIGWLLGLSKGGLVKGYGEGDTIPAMLSPGEYVLNKDIVKGIGTDTLNSLNFGSKNVMNGYFIPDKTNEIVNSIYDLYDLLSDNMILNNNIGINITNDKEKVSIISESQKIRNDIRVKKVVKGS